MNAHPATAPALSEMKTWPLAIASMSCASCVARVERAQTPWHDGTTHLVMSPSAFMQLLAALVPRPRLHVIRFHGVLAPNAKMRRWCQ